MENRVKTFGFETLDHCPTIPALLAEIEGLYRRACLSQGGTRAKPIGYQRKGASGHDPEFDVAHDADEVSEVLHTLRIELLRIRRRYWTEIVGPIPDTIPGRMAFDAKDRQRRRIQEGYPAHWLNKEIAVVEGVTDRWVRELRGADRKRK